MIKEGSIVKWAWGNGHAEGEVINIYKDEVEKDIEGAMVKRKPSEKNPAYLIKQSDGTEVLKLKSELEKAD